MDDRDRDLSGAAGRRIRRLPRETFSGPIPLHPGVITVFAFMGKRSACTENYRLRPVVDDGASDWNRWELVILNLIYWIDISSPDGEGRCLRGFVDYDTQIYFDCGYFQ